MCFLFCHILFIVFRVCKVTVILTYNLVGMFTFVCYPTVCVFSRFCMYEVERVWLSG